MDKTKVSLVAAPILVSIICIILAVNVAVASSRLDAEKAKAAGLNARIQELGSLLADANRRAQMSQDLQNSLNAAKVEIDGAKQQIAALSSENTDLKTRLETAMDALKTPTVPAVSVAPSESPVQ